MIKKIVSNTNQTCGETGVLAVMRRSVLQIVRRPLIWLGIFGLPLFMMLFISSMFEQGLPTKVPAGIVDMDGSPLSRDITQKLDGMQMVHLTKSCNSYGEARDAMQRGEIYGYFLIPENFQADLMSGRKPDITFYTNMAYYVPASLLFKTFKATAIYTKAGVAVSVVQSVGENPEAAAPLLQPVNIQARGIGNPLLNYGIYLCNSFIPAALQLMIMLMTIFSLGEETKYGTSPELLRLAKGSARRAVFGKLFPQTLMWWVIVTFMTAWLFKYNHFPMHGSWALILLSEYLFVVAAQCFAVFVYGLIPNLRLGLSVCALTGILSFSIAAFSFPEQSMYPAMSIFSWLMPVRYNFLIYSDVALNGRELFYSRFYYVAYFVYMMLPFTVMYRIKKAMAHPVYAP